MSAYDRAAQREEVVSLIDEYFTDAKVEAKEEQKASEPTEELDDLYSYVDDLLHDCEDRTPSGYSLEFFKETAKTLGEYSRNHPTMRLSGQISSFLGIVEDTFYDNKPDVDYSQVLKFIYELSLDTGIPTDSPINVLREDFENTYAYSILGVSHPLCGLLESAANLYGEKKTGDWVEKLSNKIKEESWSFERIKAEHVTKQLSPTEIASSVGVILTDILPSYRITPTDLEYIYEMLYKSNASLPLSENPKLKDCIEKQISMHSAGTKLEEQRYVKDLIDGYGMLFGEKLPEVIREEDTPRLVAECFREYKEGRSISAQDKKFFKETISPMLADEGLFSDFISNVFNDYYANPSRVYVSSSFRDFCHDIKGFCTDMLERDLRFSDKNAKDIGEYMTNSFLDQTVSNVKYDIKIFAENFPQEKIPQIDLVALTMSKFPSVSDSRTVQNRIMDMREIAMTYSFPYELSDENKDELIQRFIQGYENRISILNYFLSDVNNMKSLLSYDHESKSYENAVRNKAILSSSVYPGLLSQFIKKFNLQFTKEEYQDIYDGWAKALLECEDDYSITELVVEIGRYEGFKKEYEWDDSQANDLYVKCLNIRSVNSELLERVEELTSKKPELNNSDSLNSTYCELFANGNYKVIKYLSDEHNLKPDLNNQKVADAFRKYVFDILGDSTYKIGELVQASKFFAGELKCTPDERRELMLCLINKVNTDSPTLKESVDQLLAAPVDFTSISFDIQHRYHELLQSHSGISNVEKLKIMTSIEPEWDQEILLNLCKELLSHDKWRLLGVYDATKYTFPEDIDEETKKLGENVLLDMCSLKEYKNASKISALFGENKLKIRSGTLLEYAVKLAKRNVPLDEIQNAIIKMMENDLADKPAEMDSFMDPLVINWSKNATYDEDEIGLLFSACRDFNFKFEQLNPEFREKYYAWLVAGKNKEALAYFMQLEGSHNLGESFQKELSAILAKSLVSQDTDHILKTLDTLDMEFPQLSPAVKKDIVNKLSALITPTIDFNSLQRLDPLISKTIEEGEQRKSLYAKAVVGRTPAAYELLTYFKYATLAGVEFNVKGTKLAESFFFDPTELNSLVKELNSRLDKKQLSTLKIDPWTNTLFEISRLQGRSKEAKDDPWVVELPSFLKKIQSEKIVDFENPTHAKAFLEYFKRFGMLNLPKVFSVYFELHACNKDVSKISDKAKSLLQEIGIEITSESKTKSVDKVLGEFEDFCFKTRADLIQDKIPKKITSTVGIEMYEYIRGTSSHSTGGYTTKQILERLINKSAENPKQFETPTHLKEASFAVTSKSSEKALSVKDETALDTLLASDQTKELYTKPLEFFYKVIEEGKNFEDVKALVQSALIEKINLLISKLNVDPEVGRSLLEITDIENLKQIIEGLYEKQIEGKKLTSEQHAKNAFLKTILEARLAANELNDSLNSYVSRLKQQHAEGVVKETQLRTEIARLAEKGKNIEKLTKELELLLLGRQDLEFILSLSESKEGNFEQVAFIETLAKNRKLIEPSLMKCAILQFIVLNQGSNLTDTISQLYRNIKYPRSSDVKEFSDILNNQILEHFLFKEGTAQDAINHNDHVPFSKSTTLTIEQVLGIERTGKEGMPIDALIAKINEIVGTQDNANNGKVKVTMVPVNGIGRVMAPYSGDMCASKQDYNIANGDYNELSAYFFVVNRGTKNERIVGSVFIIAATAEDGVPTYVVRGNNPRQKFVDDINAEEFVKGVYSVAVEDVRRLWRLNGSKGKVRLAAPFDHRGGSVTNRQEIWDASKALFGEKLAPVPLKETSSTSFNGYLSYNATGEGASRVICEMSEEGEVWYGKENFLNIGESWEPPKFTLQQLDGNKGREIDGIRVDKVGFRRLPPHTFDTLETNANVKTQKSASQYALFVDTVGEGSDIIQLDVKAPHWRSITSTEGIDVIPVSAGGADIPYFEVNTKGCGYTKPGAKGVNLASYSTWFYQKPGDETNNGTRILGCMLEWNDFVAKTTDLVNEGLRCEVGWATYKPKELPYRGKMRTIEWLKNNGVLPNDPEVDPYMIVRLVKTNTRIEEASRASDRRHDIFKSAFETYNKERKFAGEEVLNINSNEVREGYFNSFFENMGKNIATLFNTGQVHTALHSSNISMAAEIMDIDTIAKISEYAGDKPELLEMCDGVPYGFLKDVIDASSCLKSLLEAAETVNINTPEAKALADKFKQAFVARISSERLTAEGIDPANAVKWSNWIMDKILVEDLNPHALRDRAFADWGKL